MAALIVAFGAVSRACATVFYVAPNGNDQWSGTLAAPAPTQDDGPFATVTRARNAIRALKAGAGALTEPVTVRLRAGTYFLSEPFTLQPQDSGTADCPITYAAYDGEKPVLSGGFPITGWSPVQVNGHAAWAAPVPELSNGGYYFHQLFVNGERRPRPRLPAQGPLYRFASLGVPPGSIRWNQGQDQAYYSDDDLRAWANLSDVDVVALHFWIESRLPLAQVDEANHLAKFARPSVFRLTDGQTTALARFYVENVFEALGAPGEWYLDRPSGLLYYIAMPGEDPRALEIIAPRLSEVVRFEGDFNARIYVEHVRLEGLSFCHTEWDLPASIAGFKQAAFGVPAAVSWQGARNCALRNCEIAHIGNYAVDIARGCDSNIVSANTMFDLGGGGVKIEEGSSATRVSDNRIQGGGRIFHSAVGIWVGNSGDNIITHNEVSDLYYTGISVGWRWDYKPTLTSNNAITFNHIHDIGGLLDDLGGVYTLSVSPGTVVRNNLIHDITSANGRARGIYTDAGSSPIVIENNVVFRADDATFNQNYGCGNVIRNNVFALGKLAQIRRGTEEDRPAFIFERNIFYFTEGQLMAGAWTNGQYIFDYNLYYDARGFPVTFAGTGMSFSQWQYTGQDMHSMIGDPKFVNPAAGDFRLAPDSPAFGLGFRAIDLSTVGPRQAPP
jgi:hypothetical protein